MKPDLPGNEAADTSSDASVSAKDYAVLNSRLPARFMLTAQSRDTIYHWLQLNEPTSAELWGAGWRVPTPPENLPPMLVFLLSKHIGASMQAEANCTELPSWLFQPVQVLYSSEKPLALNLAFKERIPKTVPPAYRFCQLRSQGILWYLTLFLPGSEAEIQSIEHAKVNRKPTSTRGDFWVLHTPYAPDCYIDLVSDVTNN